MEKIIDWLSTHDTTVIGGLSIGLLVIGGVLSQASRWLLTTIFSYLKSTQDMQIRERDMDIREFIAKRFDKIDERLDKIETDVSDFKTDLGNLNRKWDSLPFDRLFK
jgi:hypothetical protein